MGLLSFFKRKPAATTAKASKPSADSGDAVTRARTLARQRLIGAAVLVLIGIVGFPLLFETQPRPVAVDVPIDIPSKDTVEPLAVPARRAQTDTPPPAVVASAGAREPQAVAKAPAESKPEATVSDTAKPSPRSEPERTEPTRAELSAKEFAAAEKAGAERLAAEKAADRAAAADKAAAERNAARDRASAKSAAPADSARALALLEGKESSPKPTAATDASARFIVQVGAFSEANAARDARQKVEKLGLKTYTQEVDTASGKRIRVRIGPFTSRSEADSAVSKLRSAGLSSAILSL